MMKLKLPDIISISPIHNRTSQNFNKESPTTFTLDKCTIEKRPSNINNKLDIYRSQEDVTKPRGSNFRLSKTQINFAKSPKVNRQSLFNKTVGSSMNLLQALKKRKQNESPVKHKLFEKLKFDDTQEVESEAIENEFSTMQIGDNVELYKNHLVKPRRAVTNLLHKEYVQGIAKLSSNPKAMKIVKLSTLVQDEENKRFKSMDGGLELVDLGGIIDFRCRKKKEKGEAVDKFKTMYKKSFLKAFDFKDIKVDSKIKSRYSNMSIRFPGIELS
jgi:hypothetical protein